MMQSISLKTGLIGLFFAASMVAGTLPPGWTCNSAACGVAGASGVVPLGQSASPYLFVTSAGSNGGGVLPGYDDPAIGAGSMLTSSSFSVNATQVLAFSFDFVTSDGAGFSDYAWARLANSSDDTTAALLFTARTQPSGSIAPGQSLPAPNATLNPAAVLILTGTTWDPLNGDSGACYAAGCGHTGWIAATYVVPTSGSYYLQFGASNAFDNSFNTGLAIDQVTVAGQSLGSDSSAPEPASWSLLIGGLLAGFSLHRRKR